MTASRKAGSKEKKAEKTETYECYPASTPVLFHIIGISMYAAGTLLFYLIWPLFGLLYLLYMLFLDFSVYREGCVHCYYYGKRCASGRGKIAAIFFKKKDPKEFCEKEIGVKQMMPSFAGSIAPIVAAVYLVLQGQSWLLLGIGAWPLIVTFFGNPIIYGKLSCPHCKQREICCPACDFFAKVEKKGKDKPKKKKK